MSGLRSLLQISEGGAGAVNFDQFYVYNTNKTAHNNGGCCCLWTIPTGVKWFAVELWGGGGSGAGSADAAAGAQSSPELLLRSACGRLSQAGASQARERERSCRDSGRP